MSELYGPIQVHPAGLLGLLQIKNVGKNPRDLHDMVQPSLDLWKAYLNANAEEGFADSANIVSGTNGFISLQTQVPQSQWWYLHYFAVHGLGVVAGDTVSLAPAINPQAAAGGISIPLATEVSMPARTVTSSPVCVASEILVPPGTWGIA